MMQYLLLIQDNAKTQPTPADWERFFVAARDSGLFRGGSEIGSREVVGDSSSTKSTRHITGYMRFDAGDAVKLRDLLQQHPVVLHGGSVELCELPQS